MDLTNSAIKTPEAESETPTRIQPGKPSPFTNGVLKRHAPLHLQHPVVVTYKECLKNHAASRGGHAVDGCGEFMPSPTSNPSDATSLKCAACGCHRNFHRREPEESSPLLPTPPNAVPVIEYRPLHRHHPPPPQRANSGSSLNNSPSPPPISSSYYPSAPHMLLALSHGLSGPPPDSGTPVSTAINTTSTPLLNSNSRKRSRTKFSQDQKQKMHEFAERVGWKMQKRDEDMISEFCSEIGVGKGVLKVWMHNNKNTLAKKDPPAASTNGGGINYSSIDAATEGHYRREQEENNDSKENVDGQELSRHHLIGTNGSSSSP